MNPRSLFRIAMRLYTLRITKSTNLLSSCAVSISPNVASCMVWSCNVPNIAYERQVKRLSRFFTKCADFTPRVSDSSFIEDSKFFVVESGRGGIVVGIIPAGIEESLDGELEGVNGSIALDLGLWDIKMVTGRPYSAVVLYFYKLWGMRHKRVNMHA